MVGFPTAGFVDECEVVLLHALRLLDNCVRLLAQGDETAEVGTLTWPSASNRQVIMMKVVAGVQGLVLCTARQEQGLRSEPWQSWVSMALSTSSEHGSQPARRVACWYREMPSICSSTGRQRCGEATRDATGDFEVVAGLGVGASNSSLRGRSLQAVSRGLFAETRGLSAYTLAAGHGV